MKKSISLSVFGAISLPLLITGVGANAATFIDNAPNKAGIVVTDVHAKAGESFNLSILDSDMEAKGYTVESVHYSVKQVDGSNDTGLETTLSEDKKVIAVKVNPDESDKVSYRIQAGVSLAKHGTAECTDTGCISDVSRVQLPKQFMVKVRSLDNGASSEVKTDQDGGASSDIKINIDPEVAVDEPENPTSTPAIAVKPQEVESSKATPTDIKVESTEVKVESEKTIKATKAPVSDSKAIKVVKPTDTAPKPVIVSEESTAPVNDETKGVITTTDIERPVVKGKVADRAVQKPESRIADWNPAKVESKDSSILPLVSGQVDSNDSRQRVTTEMTEVDNAGKSVGSVPNKTDKKWHKANQNNQHLGSVPTSGDHGNRTAVSDEPTNEEVIASSDRMTKAFNALMIPLSIIAVGISVITLRLVGKEALRVHRYFKSRK